MSDLFWCHVNPGHMPIRSHQFAKNKAVQPRPWPQVQYTATLHSLREHRTTAVVSTSDI